MKHVFVEVLAGVATVDASTVPPEVEVHVIDYDNLQTVEAGEERAALLTPEELEYVIEHNSREYVYGA